MLKQIIFGIFLSCTSVACYQVIPVSSPPVGISSSTFYDCLTKSVYYVNFFGNATTPVLFRYDFITNTHYSARIQGYSGGVSDLIPMYCTLNQFVATLGTCAHAIYWDGFSGTAVKLREIFCVDQTYQNHNITYAKADPKRRLYVGTTQPTYCDAKVPPESSLYRYDILQGVVKNFGDIRTSSGMDWNVLTNQFYHKDFCKNTIMEYQWSPFTGELTNGHPVYQFTDPNAVAVSMVIDKYGMLYVTMYGDSTVLKIDPRTSKIVETYTLPSKYPTSITFCGPLLDTLCVNTGNIPVDTSTGMLSKSPTTPNDGKMYLIKDISTRGFCDRKVCI